METTCKRFTVYRILAHRGAGSMFGAAEAWSKNADGSFDEYTTEGAARERARELTRRVSSSNVWYTYLRLYERDS
jgi:hypothetical protein